MCMESDGKIDARQVLIKVNAVMLMLSQQYFKTTNIRDRLCHNILIKVIIYQEDIAILNLYLDILPQII